MNVAIIGCGYVGTAVARLWRQQGLTVTATTTTPGRVPELATVAQRVVVLQGHETTAVRSLLETQQTVLLSVGAPNRDAYEETYLQTAKTLATVLPQTPNVRQLIYTSSYALYGDQQGKWVDEASPIAPANRNAELLAETEQILLGAATEQQHICIFRLGGIYGPGRELERIFRRVGGTTRAGDGGEAANWVHLEDIVGAIEFARLQHLQGLYNLVQNWTLTGRELLDRVCARHNFPAVRWDPTQPSTRQYNVRVSNQKLKATGYRLIYPRLEV